MVQHVVGSGPQVGRNDFEGKVDAKASDVVLHGREG